MFSDVYLCCHSSVVRYIRVERDFRVSLCWASNSQTHTHKFRIKVGHSRRYARSSLMFLESSRVLKC
jgi:hypothetical protein